MKKNALKSLAFRTGAALIGGIVAVTLSPELVGLGVVAGVVLGDPEDWKSLTGQPVAKPAVLKSSRPRPSARARLTQAARLQ